MEFSIFRLEIRGILFGIAVLCYIVYCLSLIHISEPTRRS